MEDDRCRGLWDRLVQFDDPLWEPLLEAVGEHVTSGFMWMQENELGDGTRVQAYKHIHTRRYLYLTEDLRAFERAPCGRFSPLRLDFAIEQAICTWWTLASWDEEDAQAVREALSRAQERSVGAA